MAQITAPSKRFTLNKEDFKAFLKNAAWFLAPTLLFMLTDLIKVLPTWLADKPEYVAIAIYILNRITDLLRRYISGK